MGFGPDAMPILTSAESASIAIASTATIYTRSFRMKYSDYFAIQYNATSDGNVNLKIELEQSTQLPTTEGAADAHWVTADDGQAINAALTDELYHNERIRASTIVCLPYGRLKITGLTGNDASTILNAKIVMGS